MFSLIDSEMKGLAEKARLPKKRGRVNGQRDTQKVPLSVCQKSREQWGSQVLALVREVSITNMI